MRGFAANGLAQIVNLAYQVVSILLLIMAWGAALYGEWLVLSAIPAYLAFSDVGLGAVAGNDMTMKCSRGERREAVAVFQTMWVAVTTLSATLVTIVMLAIWLTPVAPILGLSALSPRDTSVILTLLCFTVVLGVQGSMLSAAYRSVKRYPRVAMLAMMSRTLELLSSLVAVLVGAGPVGMVLTYLSVRSLGLIAIRYDLSRIAPMFTFGDEGWDAGELRRLLRPAIAFLAVPLGNAMSIQGMVILVGVMLGPIGAVAFTAMRTVVNVARQGGDLLYQAIRPEISAAYGEGNAALLRHLHRFSFQASFLAAVVCALILSIAGPWIVVAWTRGAVQVDTTFFHLMLAVVVAGVGWQASFQRAGRGEPARTTGPDIPGRDHRGRGGSVDADPAARPAGRGAVAPPRGGDARTAGGASHARSRGCARW